MREENAMKIILDLDNEILYGSDQAYISYPTRFATVTLPLQPAEDLRAAVNRLRAGLAPVDDMEFFIGINDFTATKLDNCIEAIVTAADAPDAEDRYTIDLSEGDQREVFAVLDKECREKLGKGCEELLTEARRWM